MSEITKGLEKGASGWKEKRRTMIESKTVPEILRLPARVVCHTDVRDHGLTLFSCESFYEVKDASFNSIYLQDDRGDKRRFAYGNHDTGTPDWYTRHFTVTRWVKPEIVRQAIPYPLYGAIDRRVFEHTLNNEDVDPVFDKVGYESEARERYEYLKMLYSQDAFFMFNDCSLYLVEVKRIFKKSGKDLVEEVYGCTTETPESPST